VSFKVLIKIPQLKVLQSLIVCAVSLLLLSACATTNELSNSSSKRNVTSEAEHKSYHGKWILVKIVFENGEIQDFSDSPANYVHIKKTEITEEMPGYGVKNYNYFEKNNTFIIMSGNRLSSWKIVKQTENTLEIETAAGRYVLIRPTLIK
jgi:hypothetical protein